MLKMKEAAATDQMRTRKGENPEFFLLLENSTVTAMNATMASSQERGWRLPVKSE